MSTPKRIGILYNSKIDAAIKLALELKEMLAQAGHKVWTYPAGQDDLAQAEMSVTDYVISVGGDGTILRAARASVPWGVPILGVNLGRLGFMNEITPEEAPTLIPAFLAGEGWIEERSLIQMDLHPASPAASSAAEAPLHALNDVVIGRAAVSRVIYLETYVDGSFVTTYKADGVIIATATGSTGYLLAVGGPILYPGSSDIIVKPIAPHLTLETALVLPPSSTLDFKIRTDHQATVSVDGQVDISLANNDTVRITSSPHKVRFLRNHPRSYFFATLLQRLRSKDER